MARLCGLSLKEKDLGICIRVFPLKLHKQQKTDGCSALWSPSKNNEGVFHTLTQMRLRERAGERPGQGGWWCWQAAPILRTSMAGFFPQGRILFLFFFFSFLFSNARELVAGLWVPLEEQFQVLPAVTREAGLANEEAPARLCVR